MTDPVAPRPVSPPLPAELRAALVEDLARLLVADLARRPAPREVAAREAEGKASA